MVAGKPKLSPRVLIFGILVFILLCAIGFFGLQKIQKQPLEVLQIPQKPISCDNPATITDYIKNAWGDSKTLHDKTKDYSSEQGLYLLQNENTPHIDFRGKNIAVYEFSIPVDKLNSFVKEKFIPTITQSGYKYDALSSARGETFGQEITSTLGVFQKGRSLLEINYGKSLNKEGQDTVSVSITCGIKSQALEERYKELLALPAIQKEINKELPYSKKISNLRFEIWEKNGNFIQADLGNWNGGGSGIWLTKNENGQWVVFATGQQGPSCELMEKYHAPSGLFCTDTVHNTLSKTK